MGQRIVIKGADFSQNGLGAEVEELEDLDITSQFQGYGFYKYDTQEFTPQSAPTAGSFAYVYMDYTPVEGFTKIRATLSSGAGCYALYGYSDNAGSNLTIIKGINTEMNDEVVTIPDGVRYIRANSRTNVDYHIELLR